jgi:hypothetical protein
VKALPYLAIVLVAFAAAVIAERAS